VPAAAVIPAPIAYIKVVAVKKLVVGLTASAVTVRRSALFGSVGCAGLYRFGQFVRGSAAGAVASAKKPFSFRGAKSNPARGQICSRSFAITPSKAARPWRRVSVSRA
jgi:hypothetical protein